MIHFKCSQCGKTLSVPTEHTGKQAKCPACGTIQSVPQESESVTASVVESGVAAHEQSSWERGLLNFLGPCLLTVMIILALGNLALAIVLLASRDSEYIWWLTIPMFFNFLTLPLWGLLVLAGCKYSTTTNDQIKNLQRSVSNLSGPKDDDQDDQEAQ